MSDKETWSEDHCTCGHAQSQHADDGVGACGGCLNDAQWARRKMVCRRFQWNEKPRRRTW